MRRAYALLVAVLVCTLFTSTMSPTAADDKDDLKNRKGEVEKNIRGAQEDLDHSSKELLDASNAYAAAQQKLTSARNNLARTRGELATAVAFDLQMQSKLATAEENLETAEDELSDGEDQVSDAKDDAKQFLLEAINNGDPGLRAVNGLLNGTDPTTFTQEMSLNHAVNEAQIASLGSYDAARVMLVLKREKVEAARDLVAERRREAAENLVVKKQLEADAEEQTIAVEGLVTKAAQARGRAQKAKQSDLAELGQLETERDRISDKLAAIAERERQQALREERRRQRQERREQRRREQQQQQNNNNSNNGPRSKPRSNPPSSPPRPTPSSHGLSYPGASVVTSPYGQRFHPILHVWKLHDGTDFSTGCGLPIKASASGRIVEQYYNSAYGNRVIMSHGYKNGVSLATAYNHLTSFARGSGSYVQRGQVIGYSGTTGYSTGCHLHFMVFENGVTVDPMKWLG